jgi:hypothetical protein
MKKIFFAFLVLCAPLYASVILETSFKASFAPKELSRENPIALYTMGGQQFKVVLVDILEDKDGAELLCFEIFSIVNGQDVLMSKPMFKKQRDSSATLTLGTDEYSMTLEIR